MQEAIKRSPLNVLFVEPYRKKTSPVTTLANAIERAGAVAHFADFSVISTRELIKLYLKIDVLVIQFYGVIDHYAKKQIALAVLLGVPVVRNWAGTDVLKSITESDVASTTLAIDKLTSMNVTTSHVGLVNELNGIGIACTLTKKVIDESWEWFEGNNEVKPLGILVYLPSSNREFYGLKYLEKLITNFQELTFIIIADNEHILANYDNVESVGWVDDMQSIWEKTGLLVRMTEHDGYPRMALEALARGKYVVHNNRLPGVWFADTQEQLEEQVRRFIKADDINHEGVQIAKEELNSGGEQALYDLYLKAKTSISQRFFALIVFLKFYMKGA